MLKVYLGADHRGFLLKEFLKRRLKEADIALEDLGTSSPEPVDYPDFAMKVGEKVSKEGGFGLLVCMTGIGMSIAANKVTGVRAARVLSKKDARLARRHNDANVLCIPGRGLRRDRAWEILRVFLEESFALGRHERRVRKIEEYEKNRP